jgi:phosphatidate cytidylyltransferase
MLTLYLLLIPIITDTCAYIFGKLFGKRKLIPSISPNKSVEGLLFGTFFGTVIPVIFYSLYVGNMNVYYLIFITFSLSLIGQFGDLVFSSIKRHYDIKDYSNIMPGHGGILDRLDSIIFVILSYIFIVEFL